MSRNDKQKAARRPGILDTIEVSKCTYGIKAELIAELCGVSLATARRWKAGTSRVPRLTAAALEMGLVHFIRDWPGWRFEGQEIVSPDGWRIRRDDALSVPLMHGQISALRQRIRELEALTDEQPVPGAWPDKIGA
jgi:hypothetical protein